MEERPPTVIVALESADLENALDLFVAEEPGWSPTAGASGLGDVDDPLSLFSSERQPILVEAAKDESPSDDFPPAPIDDEPTLAYHDKTMLAIARARSKIASRVRLDPRRVVVATVVGGALVASAVVGVVFRARSPKVIMKTTTAVAPRDRVDAAVSHFIESRTRARGAEPILPPVTSPRFRQNVAAIPASGRPPSGAERFVPLATTAAGRPLPLPRTTIASVRNEEVTARPRPPGGTTPVVARGGDAAVETAPTTATPNLSIPVVARGGDAATEKAPTTAMPNLSIVPLELAPLSVPPPVTVAAATVPLPTHFVESSAIQSVLNQYRSAFSALDVRDARAVWPSVDAKALARAFDQLEEQDVEFDNCQISITGVRATAFCGGSARYVPKIGNRSAHVDTHRWKFNLRKADESWLIETVDSR